MKRERRGSKGQKKRKGWGDCRDGTFSPATKENSVELAIGLFGVKTMKTFFRIKSLSRNVVVFFGSGKLKGKKTLML